METFCIKIFKNKLPHDLCSMRNRKGCQLHAFVLTGQLVVFCIISFHWKLCDFIALNLTCVTAPPIWQVLSVPHYLWGILTFQIPKAGEKSEQNDWPVHRSSSAHFLQKRKGYILKNVCVNWPKYNIIQIIKIIFNSFSAGDVILRRWRRHCFTEGHIIFSNNQVPFELSQHRDRANVMNVSTEWVKICTS